MVQMFVVDFIAQDSVENAVAVLDRLDERAEALRLAAERSRVVPELQVVDAIQYRELIERPWRIIDRNARVATIQTFATPSRAEWQRDADGGTAGASPWARSKISAIAEPISWYVPEVSPE